MTLLSVIQAIATVAIDLNRTHATNPLWSGHARFHVVWQSSTVVLLSAVGLVLLWHQGHDEAQRFYLAALLAALSPLGFLTAFTSCCLFGGTLSDPNGIRPVRVRLLGSIRSIDLNLAAVVAAVLSLLAMLWLFQASHAVTEHDHCTGRPPLEANLPIACGFPSATRQKIYPRHPINRDERQAHPNQGQRWLVVRSALFAQVSADISKILLCWYIDPVVNALQPVVA